MVNDEQLKINIEALLEAKKQFALPDNHNSLLDLKGTELERFVGYLRIPGHFACISCSGYVTGPNIRFFDFSPETLCYQCQNKKVEKKETNT